MGKIDLSTFKQETQYSSNKSYGNGTGNGSRVSFFSLRNDKDRAIVRILIDNPEDMDIRAVHRVTVDGRTRNVNCRRDPLDPTSKCPFCNAGIKIDYRLFIPMIEYKRDEQGNMTISPKVWERPANAYVDRITNLIADYGPLSESVYAITRNGDAGSTSTTYDINYGRKELYSPDIYKKDTTGFENYNVVGTMVIELNDEEAEAVIAEELAKNAAAPRTGTSNASQAPYTPRQSYTAAPSANTMPGDSDLPFDLPASPTSAPAEAAQRPRRSYY